MNNFIKLDHRINCFADQIAKRLGDTVEDYEYSHVGALYGPMRAVATAVSLKSGRIMIISENDSFAEYAVFDEMPDYDHDADDMTSYNALCEAAGIALPFDLPENDAKLRSMREDAA